MALQHGLFTLALSALLFTPVAATAADNTRHAASPVASNWAPGRESHRAPPPPPLIRGAVMAATNCRRCARRCRVTTSASGSRSSA
ncbi:hypothetical protein ACN28S_53365 [Cystobacter fuscus]